MSGGIDAVPPVAGDEVDQQSELHGHVAPQRRELAGLGHQHGVARRQGVDEAPLPRRRCRTPNRSRPARRSGTHAGAPRSLRVRARQTPARDDRWSAARSRAGSDRGRWSVRESEGSAAHWSRRTVNHNLTTKHTKRKTHETHERINTEQRRNGDAQRAVRRGGLQRRPSCTGEGGRDHKPNGSQRLVISPVFTRAAASRRPPNCWPLPLAVFLRSVLCCSVSPVKPLTRSQRDTRNV